MSTLLRLRFSSFAFLSLLLIQSAWAVDGEEVTDAPPKDHQYTLGLSSSYRSNLGRFDAYEQYNQNPDPSNVWNVSNTIRFNYRIAQNWELGASVMQKSSEMIVPTGQSHSVSFGYPSIEGKYLMTVFSTYHLSPHLSLSAPLKWSNRSVDGNPTLDNGDDTSTTDGNGFSSYTFKAGVGLSKRLDGTKLRLATDVSVQVPMAQKQDSTGDLVRKGVSLLFSEGATFDLFRQWSVLGSLKQSWGDQTLTNGVPTDGTATRSLTSEVGLAFVPSETWKVSAQYSSQFPFYGLEVNQMFAPTVSLGMTYSGI